MRFLVMALILAATLFAWNLSSGAVLGMEHGFTLGATGAAVDCDDTECVVYGTETFQLTVNATNIPDGGYAAFDARIYARYVCSSDRPEPCPRALTYVPRASCMDEVVWPDAGACRYGSSTAQDIFASTGESYPMPKSFFVGTLLEYDVQCPVFGLHTVSLSIEDRISGQPSGSAQYWISLLTPGGQPAFLTVGEPGSGSLNIDCRAASDEPRPTPTPVPPPAPTPDEPQPTPPTSAVVLDFDTYPGGDWELVSNGGSSDVTGGILTINAPTSTYHQFSLPHPDGLWHQEVSNSMGWVIETRMRVDPVTTAPCDYGLKIWANDHTNPIAVGFSVEDVCLIYPDMVRYPMDTTDGFHVYRIESRLDKVKVYVDGDLVIDHTRTWQGGGGDILMFGDGSVAADYNTLSYWDYFWYNVTPDMTPDEPQPTPGPSTYRGDANCDGIIDAIDAALILQYVAGLFASLPCPENADATPNGNINSVDALFVLQMVAGMFNECCAGLPDFPPDVLPQPTDTPVPTESRPERSNCHPSYHGACLDPNALDYDCAGGTGNGPRWVEGPITVVGPDKFGLDRDGDGVGCE